MPDFPKDCSIKQYYFYLENHWERIVLFVPPPPFFHEREKWEKAKSSPAGRSVPFEWSVVPCPLRLSPVSKRKGGQCGLHQSGLRERENSPTAKERGRLEVIKKSFPLPTTPVACVESYSSTVQPHGMEKEKKSSVSVLFSFCWGGGGGVTAAAASSSIHVRTVPLWLHWTRRAPPFHVISLSLLPTWC